MIAALAIMLAAAPVEGVGAGFYAGAGVGAGVVGGDVVTTVDVSLGVESAPFALHLRGGPTIRVFDLPPETSTALPSVCRVLRCEEALTGQRLDPTAIARIVDEVRLFHPGDVVHARAGRFVATLGAGALVDRVTTMASWDRRTSGAYLSVRAPWQRLSVDALTADLVSPLELTAARIEMMVASPFEVPFVVGAEAAVDVFAPDASRTLGGVAVDMRAIVNEDGLLAVSPRIEASGQTGWSPSFGAGAAAGGELSLHTSNVDVRATTMVGYATAGHRRAMFQTFHLVERHRALVGADGGAGLVHVPAPGGATLDARIDASVLDSVTPLVRVHLEEAPGGNAVEAGVVVDVDPVSVQVSIMRRGFDDISSLFGVDVINAPLLGAFEASWRVYGPVSLWARWYRLPRLSRAFGMRVEDDVLVGVSVNGALISQ